MEFLDPRLRGLLAEAAAAASARGATAIAVVDLAAAVSVKAEPGTVARSQPTPHLLFAPEAQVVIDAAVGAAVRRGGLPPLTVGALLLALLTSPVGCAALAARGLDLTHLQTECESELRRRPQRRAPIDRPSDAWLLSALRRFVGDETNRSTAAYADWALATPGAPTVRELRKWLGPWPQALARADTTRVSDAGAD